MIVFKNQAISVPPISFRCQDKAKQVYIALSRAIITRGNALFRNNQHIAGHLIKTKNNLKYLLN